jgi:hypothetical protein
MLKAGARSEKGDAVFPGESDGGERSVRIRIGTGWNAPDSIGLGELIVAAGDGRGVGPNWLNFHAAGQ